MSRRRSLRESPDLAVDALSITAGFLEAIMSLIFPIDCFKYNYNMKSI